MPITGTVYGKFQQLLVSKATLEPSIMLAVSLEICFIVAEFCFDKLKHADIKGVM